MQSSADNMLQELRTLGVRRVHFADAESMTIIRNASTLPIDIAWLAASCAGSAAPTAAGEGAVTGQLAACAGSVGTDSFLDGVANAIRSDAAVLAILLLSEEHPDDAATERLQALADAGVRCQVVDDVLRMRDAIAQTAWTAVAENSVAVVAIQRSLLAREAPDQVAPTRKTAPLVAPRRAPHASDIRQTAIALGTAQNVVLVAGGGTADAHNEVLSLACILQSPITHTLRGKENVEWGNPYDIGLAGDSGHSASREALARADAVVLLGTDFAYPKLIPPGAIVVQIDHDARRIGRRTPVHFALVGDLVEILAALTIELTLRTDKTFLVETTSRRRKEDEWLRSVSASAAFDAENVAALLSDLAHPDAVFAVDMGPEWHNAIRHLHTNGSRRLIGSMRHGALADALARAAGAQSVDSERQVIALVGLRGASRLGEQIASLSARELPVKTILLNPVPSTTWLPDSLSGIDVTKLNLFSDARAALRRLLTSRGAAAIEITLGVPSSERAQQQLSGSYR